MDHGSLLSSRRLRERRLRILRIPAGLLGGGVMSRRMGMPARMIHFKLQPPGKAFFFVMAFFVAQSIFQ